MKKIKQKNKKGDAPPAWDLSDLYECIDDPRINQALLGSACRADEFERRYRGNITSGADASFVFEALREYESILQEITKPEAYARLVFSADTNNPKHGAFLQKIRSEAMAIYQKLIFFELELTHLSNDVFTALISDEKFSRYHHYFVVQNAWKEHRLTEPEEKIFNDKSLTGGSAWMRFFEQELSSKDFVVEKGKTARKVSREIALNMLYSKNRDERKAGARAMTRGLKEESRRLSFIFNIIAEDKAINDRYMKFSTPEAARHLSNETDQKTVDMMISTITEAYDVVADFYRFKKKVIGLKSLYDYDRYAPVNGVARSFSFADAEKTVLDAFHSFSPLYADIARKFFDHKWIDAVQRKGKRGGAFCSFVTPDAHPYIFLNYSGTIQDIQTLAHELGHGVHAYLMREQSYLNFNPPLTVSETSSVFAEMLVFSNLKESLSEKDKFALYMDKIEGILATTFRQAAMYKFERDFHKARRDKGELAIEQINGMWRARQEEMFKESIVLTPDYDIWWSYIPHFLHTPFYVYAYAFGELLTLSLFAKYQREGDKFTDRYLKMLKLGSSQSPRDLLAPFGVDLDKKEFWQEGIDFIKELVKEAKALVI